MSRRQARIKLIEKKVNDLRDVFTRKFRIQQDSNAMKTWVESLHKLLILYNDKNSILSTCDVLIEYTTKDDIKNNVLPTDRERTEMLRLFREQVMIPRISSDIPQYSFPIQEPSVTFGDDLRRDQCRKCKSTNISITERQDRCGDEPASYFIHCLSCGDSHRI
jgi:DNA-directed RNA polymerase subunit M/transcription elongation factor TFIIS